MRLRTVAMPEHRVPLLDVDDLRTEAQRRATAWVESTVIELATELSRGLVAQEIERRDLIPRSWVTDQPSAYELLSAVLELLENVARRPAGTVVGAHLAVRRLGVDMGVHGADQRAGFRLTRAEIEERRTAAWEQEQRSPTGTVATRSAAEGRQR